MEGTAKSPDHMPSRLVLSIAMGLVAIAGAFLPPFNVFGFLGMALPAGLAEGIWYDLDRPGGVWLYSLLVTPTQLVYPILVSVGFWFFGPRPDRENGLFPQRTPIIFFVAFGLSAIYHVASASFAARHQGVEFYQFSIAMNLGFVALWALFWFRLEARTWMVSVLLHSSLVVWITTFAFPWLGEMI